MQVLRSGGSIESVTGIAQPGHDVAVFVQSLIERAKHHADFAANECCLDRGQAHGRGQKADDGRLGGTAVLEELVGRDE